MIGRVIKSTGSWYRILDENGVETEARIRGKLRLKDYKHTNPIAVGDVVDFSLDKDGQAVIENIHERRNYIIRRSVNLSKQTHIIAANIDLGVIIATVSNPRTSTGFIDRFLVTCEAYSIPVLLVFNKMDLRDETTQKDYEIYRSIYEQIGYETLSVSAVSGENLNLLKEKLTGKESLIFGHSGVGKSTLVNALSPELNLKTAEVSDFNLKGQHTTTFAQMYAWPFGGYIIDTPGIKEFGLVDMEPDEIQDYFPEIFRLKENCKFYNCHHTHEPGCAVRRAIDEGEVALSRYESYVAFLNEANANSHSKS